MPAIGVEAFCNGLVTAAFVAFLMGQCDRRYSATQFAVLSGLMRLTDVFAGRPAGAFADRHGWAAFFLLSVAAAAPGLALLPWVPAEAVEPAGRRDGGVARGPKRDRRPEPASAGREPAGVRVGSPWTMGRTLRGSVVAAALALAAVGCTETRTYTVAVRNDLDRPVTVCLTKTYGPAEDGWESPEEAAGPDHPASDERPPGVVVRPGKTAREGPISGEFYRDRGRAVLRVYSSARRR